MQALNPYLPSNEYIPDGEPHVFGDRLYIYGSHDCFGKNSYCYNDYVCWSAPVNNLADWKCEGTIYRRCSEPKNKKNLPMYAPDVCKGVDGRYYLYYVLNPSSKISVAVCDTPAGEFKFYGYVKHKDGKLFGSKMADMMAFDPGVINDNGNIYLYSGFSMPMLALRIAYNLIGIKSKAVGNDCFNLEDDMITIKTASNLLPGVKNSKGTSFVGHEFFEASSMRKFGDKYYFIYASVLRHELAYAISDYPDRDFKYMGALYSNCDVGFNGNTIPKNYWGNNHGSIEKVGDSYYVFGHRQTNLRESNRQAIADKIVMDENGHFLMSEMTSQGLNGKPLAGRGQYPAYIACNIYGKKGCFDYLLLPKPKGKNPFFTQDGKDGEDCKQYIANMCDGAVACFKYFSFDKLNSISVRVRGNAKGSLLVYTDLESDPISTIYILENEEYTSFVAPAKKTSGEHPLYFVYKGIGSCDFESFCLD